MNRTLYLLVRLRTGDLAALTAEETIRRRVRGGERLARLDRSDLWEFTYRDGNEFQGRLEKLVSESNLFVNPNKHLFRYAEDYRSGWREEGFLLAVRGREDLEGAVAEETLRSRYRLPGLERVRYATLWFLRFEGAAGEEGLALAESLALANSPKGGLLVNPHYQEHTLEPAGSGEKAAR
ncbi:MAG: hypothetical protein ABIH26_04420 [Candidatus Eisenbacteria bacterium]